MKTEVTNYTTVTLSCPEIMRLITRHLQEQGVKVDENTPIKFNYGEFNSLYIGPARPLTSASVSFNNA